MCKEVHSMACGDLWCHIYCHFGTLCLGHWWQIVTWEGEYCRSACGPWHWGTLRVCGARLLRIWGDDTLGLWCQTVTLGEHSGPVVPNCYFRGTLWVCGARLLVKGEYSGPVVAWLFLLLGSVEWSAHNKFYMCRCYLADIVARFPGNFLPQSQVGFCTKQHPCCPTMLYTIKHSFSHVYACICSIQPRAQCIMHCVPCSNDDYQLIMIGSPLTSVYIPRYSGPLIFKCVFIVYRDILVVTGFIQEILVRP